MTKYKDKTEEQRAAAKVAQAKWAARNKEKKLASIRKWRAKNLDRFREGVRLWNAANPEQRKQIGRNAASKRRAPLMAVAEDYLRSNPCAHCGASDPRVLEFDHFNPATKTAAVSELYLTTRDRLLAEIAKCQVLCANCHRIKTHEADEWGKRRK